MLWTKIKYNKGQYRLNCANESYSSCTLHLCSSKSIYHWSFKLIPLKHVVGVICSRQNVSVEITKDKKTPIKLCEREVRCSSRFFYKWSFKLVPFIVSVLCSRQYETTGPTEVSKAAKITNRYTQVPHLTQDTKGKVTNSQLNFMWHHNGMGKRWKT